MKKLLLLCISLSSAMQAYQYSIPTLSEERIASYSKQYSWELWRTKWAKRGIKTGAVAGAALLAYSVGKGYLFGKKAEEQEASKLLAIYEAMSRKQRALLEGAANLILKRSIKPESRGWLDRSYLKDQVKSGASYVAKDVLPGLIFTPVITQVVGAAANQTIQLFADRSVQWFVLTRTKVLPLCNELKKTAAYLDPECQIFQTVKTMQMLVSPNAPIDPQMRQMLLEMLQLQMVAKAGAEASEREKNQACALFVNQVAELIHEIEKVIGFMESKLVGAYNEQAFNAIDTLKRAVNEGAKSLSARLAEEQTKKLEDLLDSAKKEQSLLSTVIMLIHHVQQVVLA